MATTEQKILRKEWVQYLRANPEKQGYGVLRPNKDHMCCLGAACEIIDPNRWEDVGQRFTWLNRGTILPLEVADLLGLQTGAGEFDSDALGFNLEGWEGLACLNDNRVPWSVIADIIEMEPKGLFYD